MANAPGQYNSLENAYNVYTDSADAMSPSNYRLMGAPASSPGLYDNLMGGGYNLGMQQGWNQPQAPGQGFNWGNMGQWGPALGALGSGASFGGSIMNIIAQNKYNKQLEQLGKKPIDINRYYQPLTADAESAIRRGTQADLGARGIQPGGYWDNQTAEVLANTEVNRRTQAAQMAAAERSGLIGALSGRQIPNAFAGGLDAFGKALALYQTQGGNQQALQYQRQQDAMNRAFMERIYDQLRTGGGAVGPAQQGYGQGLDPYANPIPYSMPGADVTGV